MQVNIADDKCQGHGRCYTVAPEVFDADEEGRGVVIIAGIDDAHSTAVELAVANCPESAISMAE